MMSKFTSLLTSSHLDIKVPLTSLPSASGIRQILAASTRRTLFFDESVNLHVIFKLPVEAADADQLAAFLKETLLSVEVAITDTPRQTDLDRRREKFEGTIVYTTTIPNTAETVQEQIDGQWYVAWSVSVPIKHGRTRITNPRVALTAILSLSPTTVENHEPKDEVITAESWKFLSGQTNLLAPLANDPTTTVDPVLPLSRIISAGPTHANRTKPGRRICRHIFPCGSPLDIRMRYNPLEPDDNNIASAEIVLLSVDLSVTPHANASVLVKNIKVEMGGGTIAPLQDVKEATLRRYDVLTLLYRYERYGGDGGRKTVSTSATMIPLLSNSAETSPQITSLWNKVLDIPNLNPLSQMAAPTQRAVSQILTPPNSARHSPKPSTGKPRAAPTHGRAQTVIDLPTRPVPSVASISFEPPNLSITVQVPSSGVKPNEEFPVEIQLVNRAYRPMKLALHVDSGQAHFRTQSRATRMDKLLPRVPMSATLAQPTEPERNNVMTEAEVRGYFLREHELRKGKPIIALTVEGKIGTLMPGQVQSIQALFLALTPGIHEITGLRVVEIPSPDTPPNGALIVNLSSCPSVVVHGGRY